jgi:tRNA uridine 5-carboxymethylaminomethyl modification enzyme
LENLSKKEYFAGAYRVGVIGAGHAGCEAALAAARLGLSTIVFALNLDAVANQPCNPNIGGSAKGCLVREIDALGGEMGKAADDTFLQSRMLNRGKGPAVHALRAQTDRRAYQTRMKRALEKCGNLEIRQCEIVEILCENGKVKGVLSKTGAYFALDACIIAAGTYLKGRIVLGEDDWEGGPDGLFPANRLSGCLKNLGLRLQRFKTGTPPRVSGKSLDYSKMEVQTGDAEITPFSFETERLGENRVCCWLTYTNERTHTIIRDNLFRSPLYGGKIEGRGPRYCPSIEDKIVRFADKDRHQIFIEPMGLDTDEMYVQGMRSSLPEDVQLEMLRSVEGLENAKITRSDYAIEYECLDPTELLPTLECKKIGGLYGAGQFNGTSGYEEAAAQGLIAGVNAALRLMGKPPLVLTRAQCYIGVLVDDLVTKGVSEPYRMMTSRAEDRLSLRQDNADLRLTPIGHAIGLISGERYKRFLLKKETVEREIKRLKNTVLPPNQALSDFLEKHGSAPAASGLRLSEALKRPEFSHESLAEIDEGRADLPAAVKEQAEIQIRYEGYIARQAAQVAQFQRMENKLLPEALDYNALSGLRIEARQRLSEIRPTSLGQAARVSGVNPADISVLTIYLSKDGRI